MPMITVVSTQEQVELPRRITALLASWLNPDKSKQRCKINPSEADSRIKSDDLRWLGVERLVPLEFTFDPSPPLPVASAAAAAAATPMDSYRVPPLKMTLETILEDKPPELNLYLVRSRSLPTQRRHHNLSNLCTIPSDRPVEGSGEDGGFFAGDDRGSAFEGGYGVSMSGPVLSTPGGEYAKSCTRRKDPFTRLRRGLRGAVSQLLSRLRQSSRRSR